MEAIPAIRKIPIGDHQIIVNESCLYRGRSFWDRVIRQEWEPYTYKILDRFLKPGSVYLDIGAWIGSTVIYAAVLGATCYAFEPDADAYAHLLGNISLNPVRIETFPIAIMDSCESRGFIAPESLGISMTRPARDQESLFEATCITLSQFCQEQGLTHVDFVKIDVEGSEEFIIKDIRFFESFRPVVYVSLHDQWLGDIEETYANLRRLGTLYNRVVNVRFEPVEVIKPGFDPHFDSLIFYGE